jgi:hypothetical protein
VRASFLDGHPKVCKELISTNYCKDFLSIDNNASSAELNVVTIKTGGRCQNLEITDI